ncbi:tellurite resistance TerB family protein [Aliihoeflea sp. 2WW]|uniref:tellurite resistance TerB family protein n=1 Tax=Aliihoeflea sp. 2WW TaxID=1381123 RepID=UPI0004678782|nr:tellurite resistance TerB family protein [Aliihoeflea sp. 2WW]
MFDPKKLIDGLLGSSGSLSKGGLGGLAGGGLGGLAGGGLGGLASGGGMGKIGQLAKDNPMATAALAGLLLSGKGRKLGGSAIKIGGMAAIAGLAYKAYTDYQKGQQPQTATPAGREPELLPPPSDTPFHPARAPQGEDAFALTIVRAMIAAARADGHIDEAERAKIAGRLGDAGVDAEAEQFLLAELNKPVDLDDIVREAQSEEQRVEIYTASRLTIDPDSRAERGYLDQLAGRLNLPDALVDHIEANVASVKV